MLWEDGVKMMDASVKKFTLKAIILVTITNYPDLFALSGQIKGKSGCVVCIDRTYYTYLNASKKLVYMNVEFGKKKKLRKMGPQQGRRGSRIRWRRNNDLSP